MSRRIPFLVLFALVLAACGSATQPVITPTQTSIPSPTVSPINTAQTTPALQMLTETPAPLPSNTPVAAILSTQTQDPLIGTAVAQLGPLGALTDISQYYHPRGVPLKSWRDVPVMPQATAGQEYPPFVYSYTAAVTLDQASQYYALLAPTLGFNFQPAAGSAGSADQAVHNVTFYSPKLVIVLTSFDSDPGHVIVVISKSPF